MSSTEPRPERLRRVDELVSMGLGTAITVLALVYTVVPYIPVLAAWEALALVYLVLVLTVFRNRTTRGVPGSERALAARVVEYLSWVLPITASGTGVTSAVVLLTTNACRTRR